MNSTIGCVGFSSESFAQKLWQDIIQAHWSYLEVEENMDKLEKRQILEVQIRQLLCHVNQSRKFYVPATNHVLGETVCRTKDLSACNMMNGFEAVHQYANNLLTKPWRPEFKTIRTYSGFYKQEVERHLIDVELMFVAMGYKKSANGVLTLKGPLCMDQVANVSRDALSAYVECQIMSEIFGKCVQRKCPIEWMDIFRIRQEYTGDVNQAVRLILERYRNPFIDPNVTYAEIQHPMCMACGVQYGPSPCSHQIPPIYSNGHFNNYAVEENLPQPPPPPSTTSILNAFQNRVHHPAMYTFPHSKSLDQNADYNSQLIGHNQPMGPAYHGNGNRQSRSFDQPTAYDFNVAGQRFPIPLNESQMFQQYPYQPCGNTTPHYAAPIMSNDYHIGNGAYGVHHPIPSNLPRTISDPARIQHDSYNTRRQMSLEHPSTFDHHQPRKHADDHRNSSSHHLAASMSSYAQTVIPKTAVTQTSNGTPNDPFVSHHFDYTEDLKPPLVPQRARNHYDYDESSANTNGSETSRGGDFDSFDEAATQIGQYSNTSRSSSNRSPHPAFHPAPSAHNDINGNGQHRSGLSLLHSSSNHREEEGVGSFEAWHDIYKEINRSQEQNDPKDLSLQGLDLNRVPDTVRHQSADKKLARAQDKVSLIPTEKPRKFVSDDSRETRRTKESIANALKKLPAAQAEYAQRARSRSGTNGRKSTTSSMREQQQSSATLGRPKPSQPSIAPISAVKDVSNRHEWSCAHCTLLNPMSVHICNACSKTKDLVTITAPKATTTCV